MKSLLGVLMLLSTSSLALTSKKLSTELDKVTYEGVLIYEPGGAPKPALVLVPNWLGINEANLKQAERIAARGYVVFVADVFGLKSRPKNADEAGKAAGALKADRTLLRARMRKALEVLLAQKDVAVDPRRVGAIGFCFGGTAALELARSGATLAGVATFHAGLSSPTPEDAKRITGKVLALHGADDPFVPAEEVAAFQNEMRAAAVDWQLVAYGGAVHSFTDLDAAMPGKAQYNAAVSTRAYQAMDAFFAEVFPAAK